VSWMKHPDFLPMVSRIWSEYTRDRTVLDKVLFKLKKVKRSLKGWGFNLAGSKKQRKNQIQRDIRELEIVEENGILSDDQIKNRIELKLNYFIFWMRRSCTGIKEVMKPSCLKEIAILNIFTELPMKKRENRVYSL
jgi:hypothetical protein